ncbi:hypothetical protein BC332_28009 [Capsicum chinense]|nr:hypothetical protein BC332_28009 [Capsicum chinense]
MDRNYSNSQLRATLNDILGLEDIDNLHRNEDLYGGYADGPDRYLDTDDENFQNLVDEEMNRSHQSVKDKDLSVFDGEEYDHREDDVEEEEGTMHDDSYTDEQYTTVPVEGGYLIMMDEYRKYNAMKKWFDRNCDIALDCPISRKDLKNILKALFKEYLDWEDDMVVPNIPDSDSNTDAIFVRSSWEVR